MRRVGTRAQLLGSRARRWLRSASALYGWRLYAVPVLTAITVVVIVQSVHGPSAGGRAPGPQRPAAPEKPTQSRHPPGEVERGIPPAALPRDGSPAALPPGGHVTRHGSGHWRTVHGTTRKVGNAQKVYTYTVEVERGLNPGDYGGDHAFARTVDQTLASPRSWAGSGRVAFRRVGSSHAHPDMRISLTSPATDHRPGVCGYEIRYETSCYRSDTHRVVINLARWVRGAVSFHGETPRYRQYVINHEVGHALGHHHKGCRMQGVPAPVMMQQTFGLSDDYITKLNRKIPGADSPVRADGKTCTSNPWPRPRARSRSAGHRGPHAGPGR
jgi:hypothetical protein